MELYLLRHGEAVEQGYSDFDRPLTPLGETRVRMVGHSLVAMGLRPDKVLTSPLVRAKQTAALVVEESKSTVEIVETSNLIVGTDPMLLVDELNREPEESSILLVGHEPFLGMLISLLVFGSAAGRVTLKKTGLGCVEVAKPVGPGSGSLRSLLTFKQMEIMRG